MRQLFQARRLYVKSIGKCSRSGGTDRLICVFVLALQLRFLRSSESIGHHDSEIVDDGYFDRDDAGALGVIAAGCQSADGAIVHPGAGGGFCWLIPGRTTRRRAAQDRLDAGGSGGGSRVPAEAAGDPGPWRQQAILGRGWWDADALRDIVREYALETLADQDAVLVLDETGFLKQGNASCGVARQYTGSAGKITNCQIGVFCAYVSRHGHAFIDRALYLPKAWTDDPIRMTATHVPNGIAFATKPALAVKMISQ